MTVKMSFARPDWKERIMSDRSLMPDALLSDGKEGSIPAVEIWEKLHIPYLEGNPTFKDSGAPWCRDFVRAMFLMEGNRRIVQEAFVMVPTKSMASTNYAALMLTALIVNKRPKAEFALFAPTVAYTVGCLFNPVVAMIEADDELKKRFTIARHLRTIRDRGNDASLRVVTYGYDAIAGLRLSGAVLIGFEHLKRSGDAAYLLELRGSLICSKDSFLIIGATQPMEPPSGIFLRTLERARAIRDGKADGNLLPLIYEPPDGVDWHDPVNFPLLHPGCGYVFPVDLMKRDMAAAEHIDFLAGWAARWLNVEVAVHQSRRVA